MSERFVVVARFYLDTGTESLSNIEVEHPDWTYEARVLRWGYVERSVSIPISIPRIGDSVIRIADTDRKYRALFAVQAGRRRFVEIKVLEEGTSEAATDAIYRGVVTNTTFGPGYCEISLQDVTNAWIDEALPTVINRTNYPDLAPGLDGAFFPIVNGECVSAEENPQGVIELPHIGFDEAVGDRYAAAIHPIEDIALYRCLPEEDSYSPVEPDEYNVTSESKVFAEFSSLTATPTYVDFLVEQPEGTKIRADIWGINYRGPWNGIAEAATFEENRNPINFFINMIYLIMAKAGVDDDAWEVSTIEAVLDKFETILSGPDRLKCDGAIVKAMTAREWLGAFCSNFEIDFYQQKNGKLAIAYVEDTDPSRPLFTAGHDVEINSFYEEIAKPTVNQCRYHYAKNYATEEYAGNDIFNNEADQNLLGEILDTPSGLTQFPRIETEDFLMDYVRDAATAAFTIGRRMNYLALGSFRQTWTMDFVETIDQLELAKLIGLTHFDGVDVGGYVNTELKVLGINIDLDRMKVALSTIRLVPQTLIASGRPLSYEEWEDPGQVNPTRSRIVDGVLAIDNDAALGSSATRADCQIDSTRSLTPNYAQLFLYDFPEPDPLRTLVSAEIFVKSAFDKNGATGGSPLSSICLFNSRTNTTYASGLHTFWSGGTVDVATATYSKSYSAAAFASNFPGGAADIWVRAIQAHSLNQDFSATIHLYLYDCYIVYTYA